MTESESVSEIENLERDPWVMRGLAAVGLIAALASWTGWFGLAKLAGWQSHLTYHGITYFHVAWLVPLSVDIYAAIGFRVWLRSVVWVSESTRAMARHSTIGAVVCGILANICFHVMVARKETTPSIGVVVIVAGLPTVMLGLIGHMAGLLMRDRLVYRRSLMHESRTPEALVARKIESVDEKVLENLRTSLKLPDLQIEAKPLETFKAPERLKVSVDRAPSRSRLEQVAMVKKHIKDWDQREVTGPEITMVTQIKGGESIQKIKDVLYPNSPTALRRAARREEVSA